MGGKLAPRLYLITLVGVAVPGTGQAFNGHRSQGLNPSGLSARRPRSGSLASAVFWDCSTRRRAPSFVRAVLRVWTRPSLTCRRRGLERTGLPNSCSSVRESLSRHPNSCPFLEACSSPPAPLPQSKPHISRLLALAGLDMSDDGITDFPEHATWLGSTLNRADQYQAEVRLPLLDETSRTRLGSALNSACA